MKSVYLLSLGCSKNLVDAECMSEILRMDHYRLVEKPNQANVIIVNTCGFIESAKQEAIDTILEMADYKKPAGNVDFLIVTGCLSQRYARDILEQMPETDAVLGTADYNRIACVIQELYQMGTRSLTVPDRAGSIAHLDVARKPSTPGTFAYLKIAEGCSNHCSYCAIPGIRGPLLSRPMEAIANEAKRLSESGFDELILIAQDTTRYGLDLYGTRKLTELLAMLCALPAVRMIRILYVYADGIDDDLIRMMATEPKIAHYLDMPIQHASTRILAKMNRHDTPEQIKETLRRLRSAIPDIILRSTVMVGFPGEQAEDFNDLIRFLKEARFDRLGCFVFSAEEGTPAYEFKPKVRRDVANRRLERVMQLQKEISTEQNRQRIGSILTVTLESVDEDGIFYIGRSYGEAPEVDPVVYVAADHEGLEIGMTCLVRILDAGEYDLTGVTVQ